MNEELLYYVWKFGLHEDNLKTNFGQMLEIMAPGVRNLYSGPDFTNSKIRVDKQTWFGNVEIHVKSSDWKRHGHSGDDSYSSLILHVVYEHDQELDELTYRKIPTLELRGLIDPKFLNKHNKLVLSPQEIPCNGMMNKIGDLVWRSWLDRLAIERLVRKQQLVVEVLNSVQGDWNRTFLIILGRSFGFKVNADPFEQIMRKIKLKMIANANMEALLFGLSGLMPNTTNDYYVNQLISHSNYEIQKWDLSSINHVAWKKGGLRPANRPEFRIAQLSSLFTKHGDTILNSIVELKTLRELYVFFHTEPNDYWESHYYFEKRTKKHTKTLSRSSMDLILINTIIPFLFAYGKMMSKPELCDRALYFSEEIKPESNSILNKWSSLGLNQYSASDSQALLELYNQYCSKKKCLFCNVGKEILKT